MTQGPYAPPAANVSRPEAVEPSLFKRAGLFVLAAVVFTVIFWSLWFLLLRPGFSSQSNDTAETQRQQEQAKAYDDLLRKYQQQARDADEIQANLKRQLNQTDAIHKRQMDLLQKQEEQARRFDQVLNRWEGQSNGRK